MEQISRVLFRLSQPSKSALLFIILLVSFIQLKSLVVEGAILDEDSSKVLCDMDLSSFLPLPYGSLPNIACKPLWNSYLLMVMRIPSLMYHLDLLKKRERTACSILLGWGLLLPLEAIFARHLKHKDSLWYYLHMVIQFGAIFVFTCLFFGAVTVVAGIHLAGAGVAWKIGYGLLLAAVLVICLVLETLLRLKRLEELDIPPAFSTNSL